LDGAHALLSVPSALLENPSGELNALEPEAFSSNRCPRAPHKLICSGRRLVQSWPPPLKPNVRRRRTPVTC